VGDLLASGTPITAEVVLEKLYQVLRPYLIEHGGDGPTIDTVYAFLLQLILKHHGECPPPVTPPAPETVTVPPPTPETVTARRPPPATSPTSPSGGLAATGLGTPALLAIVALLMIGAGLSMAAGDRRAGAGRSRIEDEG